MYKIDPSKYNGVTVLPSEIAEKHLILSSASQLKVIIYAFSRAGSVFDEKSISEATGINENEVKDALSYWRDMGFILFSEETAVISAAYVINTQEKEEVKKPSFTNEASPKKEKVPHNNPTKLTYDEICTRIGESSSIRFLLNEAQIKLARTIGIGDQSSLILLHDYYGLPAEVILTICEFARTKGKSTNMNYIYKIGVDWSQREIDTIDAADEELKNIEKVNKVWAEFSSQAGISSSKPTTVQEKYLFQWTEEWRFSVPMLVLAFEEMKTHTDKISYSYMHKVLSSWHMKNINTPEKVVEEQERFMREQENKALERAGKKNKKPAASSETTASYDIERAEFLAKTTIPVVKKRERR